jgi:tetratricopeptide (TPR) repeat protein
MAMAHRRWADLKVGSTSRLLPAEPRSRLTAGFTIAGMNCLWQGVQLPMAPVPPAGPGRFVRGFLRRSAQTHFRRNDVKSLNSLRLMAWSLALLAVVFAVFLPLGYWQLRKLAHRGAPSAPATQPVEPAAEMPASVDLSQPQTDHAYIAKGDFHMARGEYDDAISAYQEGLNHYPSSSELRQKLDHAVKTCKQEDAVLNENFKCGAPSAPLSQPGTNPNYVQMGDFHSSRGEYDDAISAYQQGLKLDPSNAALRQKLDNAIKSCKQENAVLNTSHKCGAP